MTIAPGLLQRVGASLEARAAALTGRPAFWIALTGFLAAWPLVWSLRHPAPPSPPVLGGLPTFRLQDERGRPFGSEELRGRVWVAGPVAADCAGDCDTVTAALAHIQGRTRQLVPAFRLVGLTTDPDRDRPARLLALAHAQRAQPGSWSFLSGPPAEVRALAAALGGAAPGTREAGAFHGTGLVLVDGAGRRRGTYDSAAPQAVDALVRDAALLVNRRR